MRERVRGGLIFLLSRVEFGIVPASRWRTLGRERVTRGNLECADGGLYFFVAVADVFWASCRSTWRRAITKWLFSP